MPRQCRHGNLQSRILESLLRLAHPTSPSVRDGLDLLVGAPGVKAAARRQFFPPDETLQFDREMDRRCIASANAAKLRLANLPSVV